MKISDSIDAYVDSKGGVLKSLDENDDHHIENLIIEARELSEKYGEEKFEEQLKRFGAIGQFVYEKVINEVKNWEEQSTLEPEEEMYRNPAYDQVHSDRLKGAA